MAYTDRITIEPGKRSGKPCIRGMRMTVYDVLEYLASGMTQDEILEDFPYLEAADLRACLQFAVDRERKTVTIPPVATPCIRGTRITVIDVLERLGSGMTQEQILADFPDLEAADIQTCLEYAADRKRRQ